MLQDRRNPENNGNGVWSGSTEVANGSYRKKKGTFLVW